MIKLFHATSLVFKDNQCKLYTTKITYPCTISKSYVIFFPINQLFNPDIAYFFTNKLPAILTFHKHVPNERFQQKKESDKQGIIFDYKMGR